MGVWLDVIPMLCQLSYTPARLARRDLNPQPSIPGNRTTSARPRIQLLGREGGRVVPPGFKRSTS
jgi:hypothetical protein